MPAKAGLVIVPASILDSTVGFPEPAAAKSHDGEMSAVSRDAFYLITFISGERRVLPTIDYCSFRTVAIREKESARIADVFITQIAKRLLAVTPEDDRKCDRHIVLRAIAHIIPIEIRDLLGCVVGHSSSLLLVV